MNENLLQYLWRYKIFSRLDFKDHSGNPIEVLDFGAWNPNSGPDFSMAKIKIQNIVLVGNIEFHVKSSDWNTHHHHQKTEYQNVILHVVYQHDQEIEDLEKVGIPTLELKNYIDSTTLKKYESLEKKYTFIPCEKLFETAHIPLFFVEENLIKKLDQKSIDLQERLKNSKNNYEAVLFQKIAYSLGLKVNAPIFQNIAEHIDFRTIQKLAAYPFQLESLLFGKGNILHQEPLAEAWKKEYEFVKKKYQVSDTIFPVKFLRMRPASFPTLRLSQLAHLYHQHPHLFSKIMLAKHPREWVSLLENVKASSYWDNHYTFGQKQKVKKEKKLSKSRMNLIITNTILPLIYTYFKNTDPEKIDWIIEQYKKIPAENNAIISHWKNRGVPIKNAADSQAFLFQYQWFCSEKKCLDCGIGYQCLHKK